MTENESRRVAAENSELRRRIAEAERAVEAMTRPQSVDERDAIVAAQARADSIAVNLGTTRGFAHSAPAPHPGEALDSYRRRLVQTFKQHSPAWRDVDLGALPAEVFAAAEPQIYADAERVGQSGEPMAGQLVARIELDAVGRKITRFYGDPSVWLDPFMGDGVRVKMYRKGFGE